MILLIWYTIDMIRKWDIKDKTLSRKVIDEVITRVQDIEDTDVAGEIVAQDLIDIVLESVGPEIYNAAVDDAMKLVREKLEDTQYSIEDLKQV